jgi:hypothetical protein
VNGEGEFWVEPGPVEPVGMMTAIGPEKKVHPSWFGAVPANKKACIKHAAKKMKSVE